MTEPKTLAEWIDAVGGPEHVARLAGVHGSRVSHIKRKGHVTAVWRDVFDSLAEASGIPYDPKWVIARKPRKDRS